jgi:hypothetical protein
MLVTHIVYRRPSFGTDYVNDDILSHLEINDVETMRTQPVRSKIEPCLARTESIIP